MLNQCATETGLTVWYLGFPQYSQCCSKIFQQVQILLKLLYYFEQG